MESRGGRSIKRPAGRPAIARRSCDQCRARKIGCDRASPCSNCVSARVSCTHSVVASNPTPPKQRVLISAQYEQKIDEIASSVDGIKLFLQKLNVTLDGERTVPNSEQQLNKAGPVELPVDHQSTSVTGDKPAWDHSPHLVDFIKAVVDEGGSVETKPEASEVLSSLKSLVQALESQAAVQNLSSHEHEATDLQSKPTMPPLEATVAALRWAKAHDGYTRIAWVSRILPLQRFADICQRVYFAVDGYNEVDFVVANAFLSYVFTEHCNASGLQDYVPYCRLCRKNLHRALLQLPLLLPPSIEAVAALTFGAFFAVENSRCTMAWTLITAAATQCQTLGFHSSRPSRQVDKSMQAAQNSLFWVVHRIEKGLSLRLGRYSNLRDAEITLTSSPNEQATTKIARIQGQVYEQLYSPAGLSRPDDERGQVAEALAEELRKLIFEARDKLLVVGQQPNDGAHDPMKALYLRCDIVCRSSLLVLILRAVPPAPGSLASVSEDCITAARDTLDLHHQCMRDVRSCEGDPYMVRKYINWAILHIPFVPFSVLFTHAIQLLDITDLARLERFAASLSPESSASESITHPHRVYELLCQVGRLFVDSKATPLPVDQVSSQSMADFLNEFNFTQLGMEVETTADGALATGASSNFGLSDWFYGNQQIMSVLDDEIMF